MITKITLNNCFVLFLSFTFCAFSHAQTKEYATSISSENHVIGSNNSIDSNLATKADIEANSGIALGIGAYSGHLELEYPAPLTANTTTYIKFETEDDLLSSLLGGNLGNLLSNISGVLLQGNQEFTIEAKNGSNTVLQGDSNVPTGFSTNDLRVVVNGSNDYFLVVTPSDTYDRINLTNKVGSLISLNNTRNLNVYGAFYTEGNSSCGLPAYTSFDGNGLTLDLLNIGGAGVTNPNLAIDGDPGTFSQMGLGLIGIAADIEQTIYFDTPSNANDSFYIQLALNPSLLQAGIANNIEIIAQNGTGAPIFSGNLSSLLNVDLLGILQGNGVATIAIDPGVSVDRITIRLSSLLNVSLNQQVQIHGVYSAPHIPTINPSSENSSVCFGSTANLIADAQGGGNLELRWYDAAENGTLMAIVNSGAAFTTPPLNPDTTYYVAAGKNGCSEESPRVAVTVNVTALPTSSDIEVFGNENPICSSSTAILTPSSTINGTFSWYLDSNGTSEITGGQVSGTTSYTINSNGTLSIAGLDEAGSPYTFYSKLTESSAGCENTPGDLKPVVLQIVDSNFNADVSLNSSISIEDLVNIFQGNPTLSVIGTVSGDAGAGDEISLSINGNTYDGTIDSNSNFSIPVDGNDIVSDIDGEIDSFISNGLCSITTGIPIDLPEISIDNLLQRFCESDLAIIADIQVDGNDILFFDSLTGGIALDANTPLVDGGVYFAGILNIPTSILVRVQITVELISVPPPTTTSTRQTFCESENPVIADIQVNEPDVVFYDSPEGGTELPASTPLQDGTTYYATNREDGCESVTRLAITTYIGQEGPVTIIGQFEDACLNREYTYTTESNKDDYTWVVSGGTILDGGTLTDDFVSVRWTELQDTEVSVSYFDTDNCQSGEGTNLAIAVVSCGEVLGEEFALIVYNEFTPNNDGFNDFFKVKGLEVFSNTVEVYNRNGNLVYQTTDYQNDWNGIANVRGILNSGQHLPSGTYYYVIEIPELERNLSGWLQLAR